MEIKTFESWICKWHIRHNENMTLQNVGTLISEIIMVVHHGIVLALNRCFICIITHFTLVN